MIDSGVLGSPNFALLTIDQDTFASTQVGIIKTSYHSYVDLFLEDDRILFLSIPLFFKLTLSYKTFHCQKQSVTL